MILFDSSKIFILLLLLLDSSNVVSTPGIFLCPDPPPKVVPFPWKAVVGLEELFLV